MSSSPFADPDTPAAGQQTRIPEHAMGDTGRLDADETGMQPALPLASAASWAAYYRPLVQLAALL
ncbi:MAG: hypothetical protein WAK71_28510, partial [Streptosporangiaceae bacterium]